MSRNKHGRFQVGNIILREHTIFFLQILRTANVEDPSIECSCVPVATLTLSITSGNIYTLTKSLSLFKEHIFTGKSPFGERDDSCYQVKTSILFNNDLINGNIQIYQKQRCLIGPVFLILKILFYNCEEAALQVLMCRIPFCQKITEKSQVKYTYLPPLEKVMIVDHPDEKCQKNFSPPV